jgi:hypothetical protein
MTILFLLTSMFIKFQNSQKAEREHISHNEYMLKNEKKIYHEKAQRKSPQIHLVS